MARRVQPRRGMSKSAPSETEFATKADLELVRADVQLVRTEVALVRTDLGELVRTEVALVRADLGEKIDNVRSEIRAVGVQVEGIYGILRATGERQSNLEETLSRRMSDEESRIWMRLGVVEETVSQHSKHHAEHHAAFAALREELVGLRAAYAHEERSPEIVAFEERLARIEVTLGIVRDGRE